MKTINKVIAIAFVLMMITVPFMAMDESSAASGKISKDIKVTKSFDDLGGGTIEVTVTDLEAETTYVVKALSESKSSYADTKFTTGKEQTSATVSLSWNFGSSGNKTIYVALYDETGTGEPIAIDGGIQISVSHSIWKDWTTYVVIIIVIILIIVAAYLKMRGLPGSSKKNKKTFTQIEEERKEKEKSGEKKMFFSKEKETPAVQQPQQQQPAVEQAPQNDTTSTEKQTYTPGRGFFKKRNQ